MANKNLDDFSIEELRRELARREAKTLGSDLTAIEDAIEDAAVNFKQATLDSRIEELGLESDVPKPCPRCGKPTRVRRRAVRRELRCLSGTLVLTRNHHYCDGCKHGFYPRDRELGLPEAGDISFGVEKRIVDLALNDTYAATAQRWSIHYPWTISENLARRVIDRVGERIDAADDVYLQHSLCEPPPARSDLVLVQNDGSMLPTREGWREAKMAVVVRTENHASGRDGSRGMISQARYVAVLGSQDEFESALAKTLRVERALRARRVAWIADGALGNWRLAQQLAPGCIQILDWYHAVEHAMDCAKALLGELDSLLPDWKRRAEQLLFDGGAEAIIDELMECSALAADDQLRPLNDLIRYYRNNTPRMHYRQFMEAGLPIGNGTAESSHRHVLQVRMKRAGQHWSVSRGRRMARLRAAYCTAGPQRFHRALRVAAEATRVAPLRTRKRTRSLGRDN